MFYRLTVLQYKKSHNVDIQSFFLQWRTLSGTCCGKAGSDRPDEAEIEAAVAAAQSADAAAEAAANSAQNGNQEREDSGKNSKKKKKERKRKKTVDNSGGSSNNNSSAINVHPWDSSINLSVHQPLFPPGKIIHLVRHYPKKDK